MDALGSAVWMVLDGFRLFGFCPQGFDTTLGYLEPGGLAMIWEFPKIRGTLFGGPYDKDPTI